MTIKTIKKNLVLLSIFGLVNSFFLLLPKITNMIIPCPSCQVVSDSVYSKVFLLPNAAWGMIFYFFLIIVFLYWDELKLKIAEKKLKFLVSISLNISVLLYIYLFYLQWIVIEAFCVFCLFSTLLTILIDWIYLKNKKRF